MEKIFGFCCCGGYWVWSIMFLKTTEPLPVRYDAHTHVVTPRNTCSCPIHTSTHRFLGVEAHVPSNVMYSCAHTPSAHTFMHTVVYAHLCTRPTLHSLVSRSMHINLTHCITFKMPLFGRFTLHFYVSCHSFCLASSQQDAELSSAECWPTPSTPLNPPPSPPPSAP